MTRDPIVAAAVIAGIVALAIPSMIRSLTPSIDAEIRRTLGELHAARSRGDRVYDVAFSPDGRPIGGRVEIERPDYLIAIEADGRASVRMR